MCFAHYTYCNQNASTPDDKRVNRGNSIDFLRTKSHFIPFARTKKEHGENTAFCCILKAFWRFQGAKNNYSFSFKGRFSRLLNETIPPENLSTAENETRPGFLQPNLVEYEGILSTEKLIVRLFHGKKLFTTVFHSLCRTGCYTAEY